ncbi:STAS domain-containing protein [Streptomyces sp. NBC_01239]|uniref:STAS domain-containing protein n=1 Tax=Streptomyces sp. NBC_01239 TaxID=2903792 RepID=UPI002254575B|nr:STAS domain-containing protein [Streptomyces sp. NBC_01239]MCX4817927.1 STAS domain-containing protein [Streptomyces sp. NBC_01239]
MTDIKQAGRPKRLSVERRVVDGVPIVTAQGEIDHEVRDLFRDALLSEDGVMAPLRIVVDLSGVTFMDSSGINVFGAAHRRVRDAQGWLRIAGAQESVVRVLHIVGLDEVIACCPTVEQALTP